MPDGQTFSEELEGGIYGRFTGMRFNAPRWNYIIDTKEEVKRQVGKEYNAKFGNIVVKKRLFTRENTPAAIKTIKAIQLEARKTWNLGTRPTLERGVRMLLIENSERLVGQINRFQAQLLVAIEEADKFIPQIRITASEGLGDLYDHRDIPSTLGDEYGISCDITPIAPDSRLQELSPGIYAQMITQFRERMDAAAERAETELMREFAGLVNGMVSNLNNNVDDRGRMQFDADHIERISSFFGRFRDLTVGDMVQLGELVDKAEEAIRDGASAEDISSDPGQRQTMRESFGELQVTLNEIMEVVPVRGIELD